VQCLQSHKTMLPIKRQFVFKTAWQMKWRFKRFLPGFSKDMHQTNFVMLEQIHRWCHSKSTSSDVLILRICWNFNSQNIRQHWHYRKHIPKLTRLLVARDVRHCSASFSLPWRFSDRLQWPVTLEGPLLTTIKASKTSLSLNQALWFTLPRLVILKDLRNKHAVQARRWLNTPRAWIHWLHFIKYRQIQYSNGMFPSLCNVALSVDHEQLCESFGAIERFQMPDSFNFNGNVYKCFVDGQSAPLLVHHSSGGLISARL